MSGEILINGKKITELSDMFFEYCGLKKETERLQEENEKLKENQYCLGTCEHIATEIIRYSNVCEVNSKYKQALEEIKEMILGFGNTPIEFKTLNIPLKEEDLKTNEGKIFDFYKKLKDKINEALNDRN